MPYLQAKVGLYSLSISHSHILSSHLSYHVVSYYYCRVNINEISYIMDNLVEEQKRMKEQQNQMPVKGSYGTKIEAVVRQLSAIQAQVTLYLLSIYLYITMNDITTIYIQTFFLFSLLFYSGLYFQIPDILPMEGCIRDYRSCFGRELYQIYTNWRK